MKRAGQIMTVCGPVASSALGMTLAHEHILVDFIDASKLASGRYEPEAVFAKALPYLKQAVDLGARALVDCTPAFLGRDPRLLQRLSEAAGIHIITNTGYYGAREDRNLPAHAFTESAEQLADRWTAEWEHGIEGTGIRPGFIKIGVDAGPLSEIDRKLVRAACMTHLRTGLTIGVHTGPAVPAFEQIDILHEEGLHPSAWIWIHAQAERDPEAHVKAAAAGAWVSLDGLGPDNIDAYVGSIRHLRDGGHLGRILVSHDAGWYHVGEPDGGTFRPFDTLFTHLIPALRAAGFSDAEVHRLTVENPAEAFTLRVRAT